MRWLWKARVDAVIDGDTLDLTIDCGFHAYRVERIRLMGVNCPEMKGATKADGQAARIATANWIGEAVWQQGSSVEWPFIVETFKADSFGRYLARIWPADASPDDMFADLSSHLLSTGHAVPYERKS